MLVKGAPGLQFDGYLSRWVSESQIYIKIIRQFTMKVIQTRGL